MAQENIKCTNDCEHCEDPSCEEFILEELDLISMMMETCAKMELNEFAPLMRGLISMFADVHGISVGKTLDAMLMEKYYDGDPHWEREHEDSGTFIAS